MTAEDDGGPVCNMERGQTMEKRRYRSGIPSIIHSMADKYGADYCRHLPVRYCCYMECERCKEIAKERRVADGERRQTFV